ncbi:pitrilysin family protein [Bradyrhizobium sp. CIR3A]|uniref:M16 family metallopeptidase n=1 Tax=Bradyrhizobium sp. CIR3A TaxID=2663838 RepID=UPI001605BB30|nr:pitrilysin family protein [Bradyrhizobium sp. CIR3A]MBB4263649.1 zinc protease [Bradyrhizobium sp. CIR3A]
MSDWRSVTANTERTDANAFDLTTRAWLPLEERTKASTTGHLNGSYEGSVVAQAKWDRPASFALQNGLQVVVIPDRRAPVVALTIWYKVGSADEPPGKSGLAHFLEHLMFKGTSKHPPGEFDQAVLRVGGDNNAATGADFTVYFENVPREQLGAMMEFEADRMTGLILEDEHVLSERDVVLEEFNMGVANRPGARLAEQMMAALYLNHPYGRPVLGWRHEIDKLDRKDALSFYKRFYAPNNAILIISGDVEANEVRSLVETTFGGIPPQPSIPKERLRTQEPTPAAPRTVTLADARVEQPAMHRYYLVPSARTAIPGESPALDVLGHLMGGGINSYLYRALVIDKKLASRASASYVPTALDSSLLTISVTPEPGIEFGQIEYAIDSVIAGIAQYPARTEDIELVKTRLLAQAIYARDDQVELAEWYGRRLTTGLTIDEILGWPASIREVTAAQVSAAARKWLDKKRSVTGYLVKEPAQKHEESR